MCLNEDQVVDAVCEFLESNGVAVEQRRTTRQKGIDIIARRPGSLRKLLIEAKGGTSTDPSSPKYGEDYHSKKVYDVVAKAFYTGVCLRSDPEHEGDEVALAGASPRKDQYRFDLGISQPNCNLSRHAAVSNGD